MLSKLIAKIALTIVVIATVTITAYGAEDETQKLNTEQLNNETMQELVLEQVIRPIDENDHVYVSIDRRLNDAEMQTNAKYIYYYLKEWGWSSNAIYAVLGNMEFESTINPGIHQEGCSKSGSFGYGIVQWTPARKLWKWADKKCLDRNSLYTQIVYLNQMAKSNEGWIAHKGHYQSFSEFIIDNEHSVAWLTESFERNYERPRHRTTSTRVKNAEKWENYFNELAMANAEEVHDNPCATIVYVASTSEIVEQ